MPTPSMFEPHQTKEVWMDYLEILVLQSLEDFQDNNYVMINQIINNNYNIILENIL